MKLKNRLALPSLDPSGSQGTHPPAAALAGEFRHWLELSVMRRLTSGHWHEYYIDSSFHLERAAADLAPFIRQTQSYDDRDDADEANAWRKIHFDLGSGCLAVMARHRLEVYARNPVRARNVAEGFWQIYRRLDEPSPPMFYLVKQNSSGIETEDIPLRHDGLMDGDSLALHYGEDFLPWHERLLSAYQSKPTGITILEGPPGTGKTSYIRHLMARLKDSHRFYFVPSSNLAVLKDSEFVDFWSEQRRWYPERQLAVILEDAEEALLPRRTENRAEVSVLLNITDGLLGEFLRLHVLCTINCTLDQLDPALLRPGRLVARHHFGRLDRNQAAALARTLGKALPEGGQEGYSLAEIFSGQRDTQSHSRRTVGFRPLQD